MLAWRSWIPRTSTGNRRREFAQSRHPSKPRTRAAPHLSRRREASLSTYQFNRDGGIELFAGVAAQGQGATSSDPATAFAETDGWIDLDVSDGGAFLYPLYGLDGTIGVFAVDGPEPTLIDEVSGDLPETDTQDIIAF